MRLFTPFTIPKKENCDLCRINNNKKKAVGNHFLDNLLKKKFIGKDLILFLTGLQLSGVSFWLND